MDLFLSPVPPVLPLIFFQKKEDFWNNKTPEKGHFYCMFDNLCPSVPMSIFLLLGGGDDDDATTTTKLRLPGPSPITPRDRIPREGPPHWDVFLFPPDLFICIMCCCLVKVCFGAQLGPGASFLLSFVYIRPCCRNLDKWGKYVWEFICFKYAWSKSPIEGFFQKASQAKPT